MADGGDDLRKVRAGDPLRVPHEAYNTLMDVARKYRASRATAPSTGGNGTSPHNSSTILVFNNSGANVAQYGVLALDTPLNSGTSVIDLFLADLVMNGVTPGTSTTGKYAIMLEPTGSNTIGWAAVAGMSQVIINAGTSASTFTTAESGSTTASLFAAGSTGSAQVIWRQGGTGTQWATVRLPNGGAAALSYARFIAFAGDNLITAHPCNEDASTIDLATTIYLMLTFPASVSNRPPFATFVANVDVLGYFPIPSGFAITLSGHAISGVLESFTQWPYASSVGQGPYCSVANSGTTAATIIWDWPTLHPIP